MDSWCAPGRIVSAERLNQSDDLGIETVTASTALSFPEDSKAEPVPADNSGRLNNAKDASPSWKDANESRPERAIESREFRPPVSKGSFADDELLTQGEIFEKKTSSAAKKAGKHTESQQGEVEQVSLLDREIFRAVEYGGERGAEDSDEDLKWQVGRYLWRFCPLFAGRLCYQTRVDSESSWC